MSAWWKTLDTRNNSLTIDLSEDEDLDDRQRDCWIDTNVFPEVSGLATLDRKLQVVQLSATRCSCIAILWFCLVSFSAITLCVASQRVFIVVYFVIDSVRKLLVTPSYIRTKLVIYWPEEEKQEEYISLVWIDYCIDIWWYTFQLSRHNSLTSLSSK